MQSRKVVKKQRYLLSDKLTAIRIAFLGIYLSFMIALKYAFGFVTGVEVVSFLFIMAGIFFPSKDLVLLVVCFNLSVVVTYGFGTWWLVYWVIWPADAFCAKLLSKVTRNKWVMAFLGFLLGFSVLFWYFLSDLLVLGVSYAVLNIISALPVNLIEGFVTMFLIIAAAPYITRIFAQFSYRFWQNENPYAFAESKNPKRNTFFTVVACVLAITGVVLLFIYNDWFLGIKDSLIHYGEATPLKSAKHLL